MLLWWWLTLPALLHGVSLTAPRLRKSERSQADANHVVSLRRMQLDLPAADVASSLPVFLPSEDKEHPLVQRYVNYNFTSRQVTELNKTKTHGLEGGGPHCTESNTIFDMGFYDGEDSRAYLSAGYCVVGVEADPDLVAQAMLNFAVWVATGQLRMANVAIAPHGEATDWTLFYKNKCSKEWNSFIMTVGCRACQAPHAVDPNACEQVAVTSTDCAGIFGTFGMPHYLKLDIEGAETGCFQAMQRLPVGSQLPYYVSAEITQIDYVDTLYQLGYRGFKLVRQDTLASAAGSLSGPWGAQAQDCRTGASWRDYTNIHAEFTAVLAKDLLPNDPCPGGLMPIHGSPKMAATYMWYDLHATLQQPA